MARQEGQKAKLLVLLQIFEHHTDAQHRLSVPQIAALLAQENVPCERKSIYADIAALQSAGYDIELQRGRGGGYYLDRRTFELAELKLLVDAVQSSRFITEKKSGALIKKLEGFASDAEARQLQRQVYVAGRVKSMNESVYYGVDTLYQAIDAGRMVRFHYWDWTPDRQKQPRRGGMYYCVSPWALAWENGCYYLIAYEDYELPAGIRHYRVDKMSQVSLLDEPRRGSRHYADFDLAAYVQKMFNMFTGTEQAVTIRCANHLAGAMLDRFGTRAMLLSEEDGAHFHFTVPVAVSPQFLGWICGFGDAIEVTAPADVRAALHALGAGMEKRYQP